MTHQELTREWQLERANLIAHLGAARHMLATAAGILAANKTMARVMPATFPPLTPIESDLDVKITAYLKVGMFENLPEEFTK